MIDLNYEKNITFIADHYGETEQLIQTAEECDELGHAVLRYRRALIDGNTSAETLRKAQEAVIEEIADALIMAEQLIYLEGAQGDVEKMISIKLARQVERIKAVSGE